MRLRIDVVDLYLLHWRGEIPLVETVKAFEKLRAAGKIRRWGVSNFDLDDMNELLAIESGSACAANQVLYNLENRGIEFDLLPWSQKNQIPIMAYSPVGHGRGLLNHARLKKIAKRHNATPGQIALAWVLHQPVPPPDEFAVANVIAIPKATNQTHVRDNAQSAEIQLTQQDLAELDNKFPPPQSKQRLPTL
jgi:diketogulonate reductase-like aldo/keto reductase